MTEDMDKSDPSPRKAGFQKEWERFGYAMVSPGMVFLIAVTTLPLVSLLAMSFFRIDLTSPMDNGWAGFENYVEMVTDRASGTRCA